MQRTQVDQYTLTQAHQLSDLQAALQAISPDQEDQQQAFIQHWLLPLDTAVDYLPKVVVNTQQAQRLMQGQFVMRQELTQPKVIDGVEATSVEAIKARNQSTMDAVVSVRIYWQDTLVNHNSDEVQAAFLGLGQLHAQELRPKRLMLPASSALYQQLQV